MLIILRLWMVDVNSQLQEHVMLGVQVRHCVVQNLLILLRLSLLRNLPQSTMELGNEAHRESVVLHYFKSGSQDDVRGHRNVCELICIVFS